MVRPTRHYKKHGVSCFDTACRDWFTAWCTTRHAVNQHGIVSGTRQRIIRDQCTAFGIMGNAKHGISSPWFPPSFSNFFNSEIYGFLWIPWIPAWIPSSESGSMPTSGVSGDGKPEPNPWGLRRPMNGAYDTSRCLTLMFVDFHCFAVFIYAFRGFLGCFIFIYMISSPGILSCCLFYSFV